ncbi:Putative polyketide synthase Pks16/acyl-CoA synthetase [Mycobacteroides abscessus]|nr:Putative polyketide synthase Pks16/acyl-CoA synthetase [Mycobacteroides abscessus]
MSRLREDRPGSNPVIDRLLAGAGITGRGLTSAPIGPDGASQLDELSTTAWADVHRTGLRIAGALQAAGVRPGDAVAVLAGAPGEIAPLVQGIWFSGASVTMLPSRPIAPICGSGWRTPAGHWPQSALRRS